MVSFSLLAMVTLTGPAAAAGNGGLLKGGNASAPPADGIDAAVNLPTAVIDNSTDADITVGYNFEDMDISDSKTQLTLSDADTFDVLDTQALTGMGNKGTATLTIGADNYPNQKDFEVSLDHETQGFITNDAATMQMRAIGNSPTVDMGDFTTRGNGNTDINVGYNFENEGSGTFKIEMSDGAGNTVATSDLSGDASGVATITVPSDSNFQTGTTTFELKKDGSKIASDTATYTLESYVSSKNINHIGGTAPTTSNIDVETQTISFGPAGGIMLLELVDATKSGYGRRDLSGSNVGADESSHMWVNLTVENYDPDVLQGPGDVQEWQFSENNDGSAHVNISVKPTTVYWNSTATGFNPNNWKDKWDLADFGMDATIVLGVGDMPDGSQIESDLSTARLNTDAQHYNPPSVKDGKLKISVAAPHCKDTASSTDCSGSDVNNDGFYSAVIPKSFWSNTWSNDMEPEALAGKYTSDGTTEDLDMSVTKRDSDEALVVDVSNIHYSNGDIELEEDTEDPTADAGSDISVDEGDSFSFDGTGSSDNNQISSYEWDVDDDGTYELTGSQPSHSYSSTGTKTVTLKVTDGNDNTDTDTVSVDVSSSSSGGGSSSTPTPTATPTATSTATPAPTDTPTSSTPTATASPVPTDEPTPAPDEGSSDQSMTTEPEPTDAETQATDEPERTDSGSGPGFTVLATVLALLGAALIGRRPNP